MSSVAPSPNHIAIIMDGNNRWAKARKLPSKMGHRAGGKAVRRAAEACIKLGVNHLTLFAFSSENWQRPQNEVDYLMNLFAQTLKQDVPQMHEDNIRLKVIGRRDRLRVDIVDQIREAEALTENNTGLRLQLAIDYGGRWDVANAAKLLADKTLSGEIIPNDIDEEHFSRHISTFGLPDPDLCIRTGNEYRISNFLLWQFAYTELYFSSKYWPDFSAEDLEEAIADFQRRQRRFGKTGDQLEKD